VEVARGAGPALAGAAAALGQYINMDDMAAVELEKYIVTEFDLADDKVEAAIETALQVAIQLHDLVKLFVKKPVA
jgi:hypothetical protein